jgi:hypothetical protein
MCAVTQALQNNLGMIIIPDIRAPSGARRTARQVARDRRIMTGGPPGVAWCTQRREHLLGTRRSSGSAQRILRSTFRRGLVIRGYCLGVGSGEKQAVPGDARVAADMLKLAQLYVDGALATGDQLNWDAGSVLRLDKLCDEYLATGLSGEDGIQRMTLVMGAYLGELIVRIGGRWTYDQQARAAAVENPAGYRVFPQNKVGKRLVYGPRHSLAAFFCFAVVGQLPPDAELTRREPPASGEPGPG